MTERELITIGGAIGGVYILVKCWLMWKVFDWIDAKLRKSGGGG